MKNPIPVSYLIEYAEDESLRRCVLHEMAVNGAEHLVLTAPLMSRIVEHPYLAEQLRKELAGEGLTFKDSHAPYGLHCDLFAPFESERETLILRHKMHINIAAMLQVDSMTIHVGSSSAFPGIPYEKHISRICSSLEALLPEAAACGVTLCIENSWSQSNSTDALLEIKAKFPDEHLGFCFDSGHANIMDKGRQFDNCVAYERWNAVGYPEPCWEDQTTKLQRMLPYLVNCHLHDNCGAADQHDLPGHGSVKFPEIIALLKQAPQLRVVQSEVLPLRNTISCHELVKCFEQLWDGDNL